jgi:hypothetical protein
MKNLKFVKKILTTLGFALLLFTSACGKSVKDVGEFAPYVDKFESYSRQYGNSITVSDLVIKLGTLDSSKLGVCTQGEGTPTITLNDSTWNSLSADEKELLLLHEMGHCLLNRTHDNNPSDARKWESIMLQWPQKISDYSKNKEAYLKELFKS